MSEPAVQPTSQDTPAPPTDGGWRLEDLLDLFVRPSRFFSSRRPFVSDEALVIIAWIAGMNGVMGRIEQRMMRGDLDGSGPGAIITHSWPGFWGAVLLLGVISGFLSWHLGAWWYRVRLNWSGADEHHSTRPRVVYLYARLVWAGPALLAQVIDTLRFENYLESWNDESLLPALLLVFPFWSFVVSYRGVRTVFDVRRGRALWWFLIAPTLLFVVSIGLLGALSAGLISPAP